MNYSAMAFTTGPSSINYSSPNHGIAEHIGLNIAIAALVVLIVGWVVIWALEQLKDRLGIARSFVVLVAVYSVVLLVPITLQVTFGIFSRGGL